MTDLTGLAIERALERIANNSERIADALESIAVRIEETAVLYTEAEERRNKRRNRKLRAV